MSNRQRGKEWRSGAAEEDEIENEETEKGEGEGEMRGMRVERGEPLRIIRQRERSNGG